MVEVKASSSIRQRKKKVNQIPFGAALLLAIIGVGFFTWNHHPKSALFWGLGVAGGFILQRSRFCFTAALRDPLLTGSTSLAKALVIAISTATVGFIVIQIMYKQKGHAIPGNIDPVGMNTIVGALIFGIGMVIAGGCASGTLMRVGEGFLLQIIVLIFFLAGSLWGAKDFGWWADFCMTEEGIHLSEVTGWPLAIALQFALLFIIFKLADWFGNRRGI